MNPSLKKAVKLLLLVIGAVYVPFVAIHALCITGHGWVIAGVELVVFVPMFALLASVGAVFCLPFKKLRAQALLVAVVGGLLFAIFVPVARAAMRLRTHGFELAAERAKPLIVAIEQYQSEKGVVPNELDSLVPDYLEEIPAGLPALQIQSGEEVAAKNHGNEWILRAGVGSGVMNWDLFLYFPNGDYPKQGYGGWLERIGDWAYVHE